MKKYITLALLLTLTLSTLQAGKGKLRVSADQQGAFVYVDGKKKAMIGEGFSSILLEEGEYTITVTKIIDTNYSYTQTKQIFIGEDSSTNHRFKLKRKIIAQVIVISKKAKRIRWKRNSNTITDFKLELEWQDNHITKTKRRKWSSAKKYCKNLTLSGYSDWRLPSYNELLTIVDYNRYKPAIMSSFKNFNKYGAYWSSSEYILSNNAWFIHFQHGDTYSTIKSYDCFVRCVRTR